MSKAFLKQITNGCGTLNHFVREALFICDVYHFYECNQLHRYILCVVVVIVCNEHWEQGIQIEMTCNSKLFSL